MTEPSPHRYTYPSSPLADLLAMDLQHDEDRDQWVMVVDMGDGRVNRAVLPPSLVTALARRVASLHHDGPVVAVDDLTARLIATHRDNQGKEPPRPVLDRYDGTHLETVARTWDEWARTQAAYRLLVATRLASAALED